jgi:type II secretory pathway component PulF
VVLLVDLMATLSVSTWGVLYLGTSLRYLLVMVVITFGLAFLIWMLLRAGPKQGSGTVTIGGGHQS